MVLTPWVHGPSWSSFPAPWRVRFGRRRHRDVHRYLLRGAPGGDMVSHKGESRRFFLEIKFFLISCYHVSRCVETWFIVDQYGATWIVALLCLHYPFPVDRLCSMQQWSVFFQSNFRSIWCQLQSVHIECCPKDMAITSVWFGWVVIFLVLPLTSTIFPTCLKEEQLHILLSKCVNKT